MDIDDPENSLGRPGTTTVILPRTNRNWSSILTGLVITGIALLFLWRVSSALSPFIISALVAVVVDPAIRFFERKGWPRSRSVPFLFTLLILTFLWVLSWGVPALYQQGLNLISNSPHYIDLAQRQANLLLQSPAFHRFPATLKTPLEGQIAHVAERVTEFIPVAFSNITAIFVATLSNVIWLAVTLLSTYYFMLDFPKIQLGILRLIPSQQRGRVQTLTTEVSGVFSAYLRGLMMVCAMYGVSVGILMILFRIPNPLALGFLAGILYMVPYLGALVTTVVVAFVAFFAATTAKTLVILAVMVTVHQVYDYVITPRILGGQVGLHPLVSLFALVTAGTLFGIVGVILSVPVAASILVILKNLYPRLLRPLPSTDSLSGEPLAPGVVESV